MYPYTASDLHVEEVAFPGKFASGQPVGTKADMEDRRRGR